MHPNEMPISTIPLHLSIFYQDRGVCVLNCDHIIARGAYVPHNPRQLPTTKVVGFLPVGIVIPHIF